MIQIDDNKTMMNAILLFVNTKHQTSQSINQQRRHHYDRDNCYCTGVTQEHSCHLPSADTVDTVNRLTVTGQKKKRENRIKLLLVIL
jgi:uncharacterized transporter YbjL